MIVDEIHARRARQARRAPGADARAARARVRRRGRSASGCRRRSGRSSASRACWSARRGPRATARAACAIVDIGHRRALDLAIELPDSELEAVASTRADGARSRPDRRSSSREHRTTLVFVNTRRLAERVAHQLAERLGEEHVAAHHGSLSKERRLRVEAAAARGRAQGARRDRVARARHRHRPRRPGLPDRLAAQHRDASCSASAARATRSARCRTGGSSR